MLALAHGDWTSGHSEPDAKGVTGIATRRLARPSFSCYSPRPRWFGLFTDEFLRHNCGLGSGQRHNQICYIVATNRCLDRTRNCPPMANIVRDLDVEVFQPGVPPFRRSL